MATQFTSVPAMVKMPTGSATMSPAMRSATRYARYLMESVQRWLVPPILEIGAGFGTYTEMLLQRGRVVALDIDADCLGDLQQRFASFNLETVRVDLEDHSEVRRLKRWDFRSAFSSNVLEHIADDVGALTALAEASPPGARLCLIVPAHQQLYGYMDAQAGHYRRYTRQSLTQVLQQSGWNVHTTFYINALGGLGWWVNQRLLPARALDSTRVNSQLILYDRLLIPLARWTDFLFHRVFGLSVVAVAEKRIDHPRTPVG